MPTQVFPHFDLTTNPTSLARLCAALLALVFLVAGCATTQKVKLPKVVGAKPTSTDLINAVNQNSEKIKTLYTSSGTVGLRNQPGSASCTISFQKNANFRLVGYSSLMGGRVIDCGANDRDFWYWNKLENGDDLYTCAIENFHDSDLSNVFPLEPSWFPEALGILTIAEDDVVDEPRRTEDGYYMEIKRKRPDGEYREYITFAAETAAIMRQDIKDPSGNTIVTIKCKEHQYLEDDGVVLPKRFEIFCRAYDLTFDINLGTPTLNDSSKIADFAIPTDIDARRRDLSSSSAKSTAGGSQPAPAQQSNANASEAPNNGSTNGNNTVDANQYEHGPLTKSETKSNEPDVVAFPTKAEIAAQGSESSTEEPIAYQVETPNLNTAAQTEASPTVVANVEPPATQTEPASAETDAQPSTQSSVAANTPMITTAIPQTSYATTQSSYAPQTSYGAQTPLQTAPNGGTIMSAENYITAQKAPTTTSFGDPAYAANLGNNAQQRQYQQGRYQQNPYQTEQTPLNQQSVYQGNQQGAYQQGQYQQGQYQQSQYQQNPYQTGQTPLNQQSVYQGNQQGAYQQGQYQQSQYQQNPYQTGQTPLNQQSVYQGNNAQQETYQQGQYQQNPYQTGQAPLNQQSVYQGNNAQQETYQQGQYQQSQYQQNACQTGQSRQGQFRQPQLQQPQTTVYPGLDDSQQSNADANYDLSAEADVAPSLGDYGDANGQYVDDSLDLDQPAPQTSSLEPPVFDF